MKAPPPRGSPEIEMKPIQWIGVPPPTGKLMRFLKWAERNPVTTLACLGVTWGAILVGVGMLIGALIW